MLTLTRARRSMGEIGEALPTVFPSLEHAGCRIRRGQITLIAAAPNVGKSVFALRLSLELALKHKVPGLYVSADTDPMTMWQRSAASAIGHSMADVEKGDPAYYDAKLNDARSLRWVFDPNPTLDDIDNEVLAFAHVYGEYPHVIIVDNLSNIFSGDFDGTVGLDKTLDFLHALARQTGAAVIVLHHLTSAYDDGREVPPLSALRGKVSKTPEVVLTLWTAGDAINPLMGVAIVKNRNGARDALGNVRVMLQFDPERMYLA